MATHSSVLAWRIPGTGEPGGLPCMGSHRVRHDWSDLAAAAAAGTSLEVQWLGLQTSPWIWSLVWELRSPWLCVGVGVSVCVRARSQSLSHVWLSLTLWTIAHQTPLSMGFSGQEYWSGLPFPPLGHLPSSGIQPASPASPACILGRFFTDESSEKLSKKNKNLKAFF